MGKRVRLHSLNSVVYNDMVGQIIGFDHPTSRFASTLRRRCYHQTQ